MRKTLLTLLVLATASCGEPPSPTVKFRRPVDDPSAAPKRSLLLGLDDSEHKFWFDEMAVAGNYVYFNLLWHGMYRMPKYGGDVYPIEEAHGVEDFRGVATNGTDVYWSRQSAFGSVGDDFPYTRLRRQALAGDPVVRTVTEGGFVIGSLFAGSDVMYGTLAHPRENFWDLVRFAPDGGQPSASLFRLAGFAIDDPHPKTRLMLTDQDVVYFTSWDFAYEAATNTELTRLDLRTSEIETLATFTTGETVVGADATHLYLTAGKRLLKLAKPGDGQPVLLATFDEDLYSLLDRRVLVDEANVYVVSGAMTLWSVPKEGGTPRALATNFPGGIDHLAQDDGNIFVMYAFAAIDIVPKTASVSVP